MKNKLILASSILLVLLNQNLKSETLKLGLNESNDDQSKVVLKTEANFNLLNKIKDAYNKMQQEDVQPKAAAAKKGVFDNFTDFFKGMF